MSNSWVEFLGRTWVEFVEPLPASVELNHDGSRRSVCDPGVPCPTWRVCPAMSSTTTLLDRLVRDPGRRDRVTHVERVPTRQARTSALPQLVPELLLARTTHDGLVVL